MADVGPIGGCEPDASSFTQVGGLLYFTATTDEEGQELFAVPIAALMDGDLDRLDYAAETANDTDPFDADSDDDGLADGAEVLSHGTDPLEADTDGDGYGDGEEIAGNSDPLDPESVPTPVPVTGPWGIGALTAMLLAFSRRGARSGHERTPRHFDVT